jgi:hypothetical protein
MRTAGDEMDVGAGAVECRADVGPDGSGAEDCDFHGWKLRSVRVTEELPTLSTGYCLQDGESAQQGF